MQAFVLAAGRRMAAGAVAGSVATASQPSAQAREIAQVQERPASHAGPSVPHKAGDGEEPWLVTDLDQEVLVFRPYQESEIEAAIAQVHAMMDAPKGPETPTAGGLVSPASTDTTMGVDADAVLGQPMSPTHSCERTTESHPLELEVVPTARAVAPQPPQSQEQMQDFLAIANKLLRRPGLQKEVFQCMCEDAEVRALMMRQSRNIDAYLSAVGVSNPRLLPDAAASPEGPTPLYRPLTARITELRSDRHADGGGGDGDVLQAILAAVARAIDTTGSLLAGLGGWLRDRVEDMAGQLAGLLNPNAAKFEESGAGGAGGTGSRAPRRRRAGDAVVGAVMVVTVAVMCVLLATRPVVTVATVATAAFAQQHAAQQRASVSGSSSA